MSEGLGEPLATSTSFSLPPSYLECVKTVLGISYHCLGFSPVPSAGCESGSVYFPCSCPPTSGWWWFSARFARSMWAALLLLLYCPSRCPLVFTHVIPSGHVPFFFCGVGVIGRCLNENFVGELFFPIHQFSDYLHGDSLLIINS